jgi:hypothetical protein
VSCNLRFLEEEEKTNKTTGELSSVDGYMNIALEKTVEYVGGEVRNKYGDVFIRGNNGGAFFTFFTLHGGWADVWQCYIFRRMRYSRVVGRWWGGG